MAIKFKHETLINDCLHNCDRDCVKTYDDWHGGNIVQELLDTCELNMDDLESNTRKTIAKAKQHKDTSGIAYGRGIINGIVSAIMAITGASFHDALLEVYRHTTDSGPHGPFNTDCVPPAWLQDWQELWRENR